MNLLIGGLLDGTTRAADRNGIETMEDVREFGQRIAQLSPETADVNRQIKRLLGERAYSCSRLGLDREAAVQKMKSLFEFLIEHPAHVSPGYREHLEDTPPHRVVCDYIAGMTDAYLNRVHAELLR